MHILQITIFFEDKNCPHQRELFPKYGSLSWKNILLYIQKTKCNCEGHILRAYIYHVVFHFN